MGSSTMQEIAKVGDWMCPLGSFAWKIAVVTNAYEAQEMVPQFPAKSVTGWWSYFTTIANLVLVVAVDGPIMMIMGIRALFPQLVFTFGVLGAVRYLRGLYGKQTPKPQDDSTFVVGSPTTCEMEHFLYVNAYLNSAAYERAFAAYMAQREAYLHGQIETWEPAGRDA